jgi:hypothetical protein
MPVLAEMVLFFTMAYPEFVTKHPQLKSLMMSIWTESRSFFVTATAGLDIRILFKAYQKGERRQLRVDEEQLRGQQDTKFKMSHNQRILHLLIIIRDIVSLCEFDLSYLAKLTHDVLALSAFAYYELNILFQDAQPYPPAVELLDQLVRLAKLYLKYEETVQRFFVFNLGSVDCVYLSQLCDQFASGAQDWQQALSSMFESLLYNLQTVVDLDEFDGGTRYDFTPYLVTHSRICQHFNNLSLSQRTAYFHPLLEHLETIRLHVLFAQSPIRAFLQYCPIHKMWGYSNSLAAYLKAEQTDTHLLATIFELYTLFNLDLIASSILESEFKRLNGVLQTSRADLLNQVSKYMNTYLLPDTPMASVMALNRLSNVFHPEKFVYSPKALDIGFLEAETKYKRRIWQLKELLIRLPEKIEFQGQQLEMAPFIAARITSNLVSILFPATIPQNILVLDQAFSAATEFLWPFFALLGSSFPTHMFAFRFDQACYHAQSTYLDLVGRLRAPHETDSLDPAQRPRGRLLVIVAGCLAEFLENDYQDALYAPYSRRFAQAPEKMSFSYEPLEKLLANFGLHAAFVVDHIATAACVKSITTIMSVYAKMAADLSVWLTDARGNGTKWLDGLTRPELETAGREMIRLGVALTVRELLRDASATLADRTMGGLAEIVRSAQRRSRDTMSEKECLLIELLSTAPFYHFIEGALEKSQIVKATDPTALFFFLAVILGSPYWSNVIYSKANAYLSQNMHLYPVAMGALVALFKSLSVANDFALVADGMTFFFEIFQRIVDKVTPTLSPMTAQTYLVLVDLLPRHIPDIEYGRVAAAFPRNLINEAYGALELAEEGMIKGPPLQTLTKTKKGKK